MYTYAFHVAYTNILYLYMFKHVSLSLYIYITYMYIYIYIYISGLNHPLHDGFYSLRLLRKEALSARPWLQPSSSLCPNMSHGQNSGERKYVEIEKGSGCSAMYDHVGTMLGYPSLPFGGATRDRMMQCVSIRVGLRTCFLLLARILPGRLFVLFSHAKCPSTHLSGVSSQTIITIPNMTTLYTL